MVTQKSVLFMDDAVYVAPPAGHLDFVYSRLEVVDDVVAILPTEKRVRTFVVGNWRIVLEIAPHVIRGVSGADETVIPSKAARPSRKSPTRVLVPPTPPMRVSRAAISMSAELNAACRDG